MINLQTTRGSCTVGDEISLLSQTRAEETCPGCLEAAGPERRLTFLCQSYEYKRRKKQHRGIKSGEKMNTRRHKSITEKHKHTTSTQRHHKKSTHFVSLETRVVSHDGLIMSRSHAGTQLCTFSSYYRHTVRCREDATLTSLQEQVSCLQGTLMQ